MKTPIKVRPLAPAEQEALEAARDVVKPMCDLLRMVSEGWPVATLEPENEADDEGELRRRFFVAEKLLKDLPTLQTGPLPKPMTPAECDAARNAIQIACNHPNKTFRNGTLICEACHKKIKILEDRYEAQMPPPPKDPEDKAPPPEEEEDPNPAFRKPLFKDNEKMRLGDGYSESDKKKIKAIMVRIVSSQVAKGEVNAEDPESLKKATIEAGKLAKAAYDAAIDFLRG